jgi:hypothetical protein
MAGVRRVVIQEAEEDLKLLMRQQRQVGDKERIQLLRNVSTRMRQSRARN